MTTPYRVEVTDLDSNGFYIYCTARLYFEPAHVLAIKRLRLTWELALNPPPTRDFNGRWMPAVQIPKAWRPTVIAAIVEQARAEGYLPAEDPA